jgi:kinetochore protein Mis13/DSN1
MRALTRVDQERPPGTVGDAAWRAAREVQRVGESGVGAIGERGLTGVLATPKKIPGTLRRGNTPGRDR